MLVRPSSNLRDAEGDGEDEEEERVPAQEVEVEHVPDAKLLELAHFGGKGVEDLVV